MGRGVHFTAVVIADADARRRRALRDVVGGLEEVDAVTEAGTALEAARHARDASLVLVDCSLPDADVVDAIALVPHRPGADGQRRRERRPARPLDARPRPHPARPAPLRGARIFAVCDAMEAMTAPRPYRGPLAAATAYGRVLAAAGRQFDPGVVDALEHGVRDESLGLLRQLEPAAR